MRPVWCRDAPRRPDSASLCVATVRPFTSTPKGLLWKKHSDLLSLLNADRLQDHSRSQRSTECCRTWEERDAHQTSEKTEVSGCFPDGACDECVPAG